MNTATDIRPRRRVERIIWEFGGVTKLANLLGLHPSGVWRWQSSDRIPAKWQGVILDHSERLGLKITAKDLIG